VVGDPWSQAPWSTASGRLVGPRDQRGTRYNSFLIQPFVRYFSGGGWEVGNSPVNTANGPAVDNKAWTRPLGGQVGGRLPANLATGAYGNAVRPEFGPTWPLNAQVTFVFQSWLGLIASCVPKTES
jgi:hypothetical protein